MSNAHTTDKGSDSVRIKNIANHAIRLALVEPALMTTGHDTARILPTVLKECEPLADLGSSVDVRVGEEKTKNPAHWNKVLSRRQ
jgi:hypothetical protein